MSLDDTARLAEVARSGLIGSVSEERFDRITRLVTKCLRAPVALVSIVDDSRQFFKSADGLPEPWVSERQTPLTHSFCQHVVITEQTLRIDDARRHPLVRDNLAILDLNVIAYLGVPIRAPSGLILGSLCAIDTNPRIWSDDEEATLLDLAIIVEDQLSLVISEKRLREILNTMPQMVWSTLPDGFHDFYNDRWYEFTGVPYGSTDGEAWNEMFHPEDQERAWGKWRHSLATGEPYEIEYRLRHYSGEYRWTLGRALPIRDVHGVIERWFGTCTDIHDLKEAENARDLIARELSHRIQNIFAAVGGLASIASRNRPAAKEFSDDLIARIRALSRAHRYIGIDVKFGKPLADVDQSYLGLISTILAPYQAGHSVSIDGTDEPIGAEAVTPLALILHELATNSLKYGALSRSDGKLRVGVSSVSGASIISWIESGGPPVQSTPGPSGFGSHLVTSMISLLGGKFAPTWSNEGLKVEITLPH